MLHPNRVMRKKKDETTVDARWISNPPYQFSDISAAIQLEITSMSSKCFPVQYLTLRSGEPSTCEYICKVEFQDKSRARSPIAAIANRQACCILILGQSNWNWSLEAKATSTKQLNECDASSIIKEINSTQCPYSQSSQSNLSTTLAHPLCKHWRIEFKADIFFLNQYQMCCIVVQLKFSVRFIFDWFWVCCIK